jgi:hypothetical protein
MRIVWIEDFGGDLFDSSEATIDEFFGSVVQLSDGWLGNKTLRDSPELLERQCVNERSRHSIRLYSRYWDFWDWIKRDGGLQEADVILIDLNLEDAFDTERPPPNELKGNLRHTGFKLFSELTLKHGFDGDFIAFLTANEHDIHTFNKWASESHLPQLTCFPKTEAGKRKLGEWLEGCSLRPYADVRRALIDSLSELNLDDSKRVLGEHSVQRAREMTLTLLEKRQTLATHPDLIGYAISHVWDSLTRQESKEAVDKWMRFCRHAFAHVHFMALRESQLALVIQAALLALNPSRQEPDQSDRILAEVSAREQASDLQFHNVTRQVVDALRVADSIESTRDINGRYEFKRSNTRISENDELIELVGFALKYRINCGIPSFNLYAAGLWALMPKELRSQYKDDQKFQSSRMVLLAKAARHHF